MDKLTVTVPSYLEGATSNLTDGLRTTERLSRVFNHFFQTELWDSCPPDDKLHYSQLLQELTYMLNEAMNKGASSQNEKLASLVVVPPPPCQTDRKASCLGVKPYFLKLEIPEAIQTMTSDLKLGLAYKRDFNEVFLGFFESERFQQSSTPEAYTEMFANMGYLLDQCIVAQQKGGGGHE